MSLVGLLVIGIELGLQIAIDPTVAICVSVFTVSIYVLFFHRLVGRMGWIISQSLPSKHSSSAAHSSLRSTSACAGPTADLRPAIPPSHSIPADSAPRGACGH